MSCEKMENRILAYVDGRLKESERLDVEKHLATCAPCHLRVDEFRAVSGLLDELPVIEPSPAFDARVHALVSAEPVKADWWGWMRVSPRVAFAASALLVASLWFGYHSRIVEQPIQVDDAQMMQDLPVLEDHDVLTNFEPLKELPAPADDDSDNLQQQM
jgi:anti-sigma factor RsiW